MIGRKMTSRRLCNRPAVFFSDLRLIALPFPHGNIRRFKKNITPIILLFKNP
jgi:hypothetical protein